MDVFARALIIADKVLKDSEFLSLRKGRYSSFDKGTGADFENGKLSLDDLRKYAEKTGEPEQISGKQELYETIINNYI
jgi:xylose isomerase